MSMDPIPMSERRAANLDKGPYTLDAAGQGRAEFDCGFFMLCYWTGRYLGYIEEGASRSPAKR